LLVKRKKVRPYFSGEISLPSLNPRILRGFFVPSLPK